MSAPGPFELHSRTLGALPVVNLFLARMHLGELLERHLPGNDARLRLDPAVVIGLLVRNIIVARRPTRWASGPPATTGPCSGSVRARWARSTTTGSGACWTGSSTPTGPA